MLLQQGDQHRRFALQAGGQGGVAHLHLLICKAVCKAVGPCCGAHTVLGHVRPVAQPVKVGTAAQHHGCGGQCTGAAPALLEVETRVHIQVHCQCSGQTGKQKSKAQNQGQQSFFQGVRCGGIHGSVFPFLFLCGSHRDLPLQSIPACNPFVNNSPSFFSISTRLGDIRCCLFTNFSAIFHAFDKVSSYPPHNYENIFLFSPGAQSAKRSAVLRIRLGISENNSRSKPCGSPPIIICRSRRSKCLLFSKIHILVYKFRAIVCPILPLFIGILPNNALKSLYQTPKLFYFAKSFL